MLLFACFNVARPRRRECRCPTNTGLTHSSLQRGRARLGGNGNRREGFCPATKVARWLQRGRARAGGIGMSTSPTGQWTSRKLPWELQREPRPRGPRNVRHFQHGRMLSQNRPVGFLNVIARPRGRGMVHGKFAVGGIEFASQRGRAPRGRGMRIRRNRSPARRRSFNVAAPARARNDLFIWTPIKRTLPLASTWPRPRGRGIPHARHFKTTFHQASTWPRPRRRE